MNGFGRRFLIVAFVVGFGLPALAQNLCAVCGKPIYGTVYLVTDKVTGVQKMVCGDCVLLPRCFLCGMPVNNTGLALPDGRRLCARDAKTAVLDAAEAQRICAGVDDDLDKLFSRFTSFPTNVDVSFIDRVDVDSEFDTVGHTFESPDLLGWMATKTNGNRLQYKIGLLLGLPPANLKAVSAHELSHAWVRENLSPERHAQLGRDAEEGFCEMVAYLLMDSQNEAGMKKFILQNHYTRGQVQVFLAAEQKYGFNQILEWMQYGEAPQLTPDNLDAVRDVKASPPASGHRISAVAVTTTNAATAHAAPPAVIRLQGIVWGGNPMAIINGRSFFANDQFSVKVGTNSVSLRCLAIQKDSVRVRNVNSGQEQELHLEVK